MNHSVRDDTFIVVAPVRENITKSKHKGIWYLATSYKHEKERKNWNLTRVIGIFYINHKHLRLLYEVEKSMKHGLGTCPGPE